jgi:hypothetical protein
MMQEGKLVKRGLERQGSAAAECGLCGCQPWSVWLQVWFLVLSRTRTIAVTMFERYECVCLEYLKY